MFFHSYTAGNFFRDCGSNYFKQNDVNDVSVLRSVPYDYMQKCPNEAHENTSVTHLTDLWIFETQYMLRQKASDHMLRLPR